MNKEWAEQNKTMQLQLKKKRASLEKINVVCKEEAQFNYSNGEIKMVEIRYVQAEDKEFWYSLDRHLPEQEFDKKIRDKRGYVLLEDNEPVGLLRYNLFWDNTPFCTM